MLLEMLDFQGLDKTRPRLGLATVSLDENGPGRTGSDFGGRMYAWSRKPLLATQIVGKLYRLSNQGRQASSLEPAGLGGSSGCPAHYIILSMAGIHAPAGLFITISHLSAFLSRRGIPLRSESLPF